MTPNPIIPIPTGTTATITGSGFKTYSRVRWNFNDRVTRYIDEHTIEMDLLSADVRVTTMGLVTVENPAPGGGQVNYQAVVGAPAPTLTALSVTSATAGSVSFDITLSGSGFTTSSTVLVNDSLQLAKPFLSDTLIKATIPASVLASPGVFRITVLNFPPAGGLSAVIPFTVKPRDP